MADLASCISDLDYHNPTFRLAWMRLARTKNVGARTFSELIRLFHDPREVLEKLPELAVSGGFRGKFKVASAASIEREIYRSTQFGASLLLRCDERYPKMLLHIHDPPPVLTIKGRMDLLDSKCIGIVGARNASSNGCSMAQSLAMQLGGHGYTIVSGLAKGIDASSHVAALKRGTVGVIACGIDNVYPKENKRIHDLLYKEGLVVTEYAIGQSPISKHFPQRNRIISGLSIGVVVVEAAKRSGTLITARLALEQGREVFAVPGSPLDPRCQGTNQLIKNGAILVESVEDIIYGIERLGLADDGDTTLSDQSAGFSSSKFKMPTDNEMRKYRDFMMTKLSYSPISVHSIIKDVADEIPARIVNLILLELELAGSLERNYWNCVSLKSSDFG